MKKWNEMFVNRGGNGIGSAVFGCWCVLGDSFSVELVAAQGYDYVCVDLQHGIVGYRDMVGMVQAASSSNATCIARAAANDFTRIGRLLDAGVAGVIVPLVNTPEEAAAAVAACRYPPDGRRSYGPIRARLALGSGEPEALGEVGCVVMVETADALRRVEAIAETPGLDGIYVGPSDLALGLGRVPGSTEGDVEFEVAVDRVRKACEMAGIVAGIHCSGGAVAARRAREGFKMVTVATTADLLFQAAGRELGLARAGLGQ